VCGGGARGAAAAGRKRRPTLVFQGKTGLGAFLAFIQGRRTQTIKTKGVMMKLFQSLRAVTALSIAALAAAPHPAAVAGDGEGYELAVSANVGFLSQYIFRGLKQSHSAANGGIDVEYGPFYIGAWAADLRSEEEGGTGGGAEYDLYAGASFAVHDIATLGVGYTTYQYTDHFDDEYNEVNLTLGLASEEFPVGLDLEYSFGDYNGDYDGDGDNDDRYSFFAATASLEGFYATAGAFSQDADGDYFEVGYGATFRDVIEVGIGIVNSDKDLDDDTRVYLSVGTALDLL